MVAEDISTAGRGSDRGSVGAGGLGGGTTDVDVDVDGSRMATGGAGRGVTTLVLRSARTGGGTRDGVEAVPTTGGTRGCGVGAGAGLIGTCDVAGAVDAGAVEADAVRADSVEAGAVGVGAGTGAGTGAAAGASAVVGATASSGAARFDKLSDNWLAGSVR